MRRGWVGLVVGLMVAAAFAGPARADTNGVKVGNGRMHPSVDLEARYDSLAGVGFDGGDGTTGDLILRVRPGLSLEIPGPTTVFNLDAKADWNRYLGLDVRGTRSLSYLGGDAHIGLKVNPNHRYSVNLGNRFSHSDRTSAVGLGVGVLSLFNEAYVDAPLQPGGGALSVRPSYSFAYEGFLSAQTVTPLTDDANLLNYFSHRPGIEFGWRFLPKTAIVLDVRSDIRRYADQDFNVDSNALYALLGLSGLVTPRIALVARAGYGNSFVPEARRGEVANYQSFVGQLDGTYIMSETVRMKLGVARTFFPVPRLGWYGDNRFYATGQALLGGRLLAEMDASLHLLNYATGRSDVLLNPSASARYRVTPWLNVGVGYGFSLRRSSEAAADLPSGTDYDRHELFGSIEMTY